MAESAARSSTTSAISAEKQPASKKSAKAERPSAGKRPRGIASIFAELARLAEMSTVERKLRDYGFRAIAGTDEVGRGSLAGPVVAAAVVLEADSAVLGVHDSKQLTLMDRQTLCRLILREARAVAVGVIEPHVIDRINILQASKTAMREAVDNLTVRPDILLLDAVIVESLDMPQVPLIAGDRRSLSIAAASIIAKVYRDMLMESYHEIYPQYDFRSNRGYGTDNHWIALGKCGPSPIHRRSFLGASQSLLF